MKKHLLLILPIFLFYGCGEKTYSSKEIEDYKLTVSCEGYTQSSDLSDIEDETLRKVALEVCERQKFLSTDNIKPSKKQGFYNKTGIIQLGKARYLDTNMPVLFSLF